MGLSPFTVEQGLGFLCPLLNVKGFWTGIDLWSSLRKDIKTFMPESTLFLHIEEIPKVRDLKELRGNITT